MLKKSILLLLVGLLGLSFAVWPNPANAQTIVKAGQQGAAQTTASEQIKIQVAKLGVGEKAKATITLRTGKKTKGYISRVGDEDFVSRDRKTDTPTTIRYEEVAKIEGNRGHSTAKHVGIGVGIGVGGFLTALLILLAHLD